MRTIRKSCGCVLYSYDFEELMNNPKLLRNIKTAKYCKKHGGLAV